MMIWCRKGRIVRDRTSYEDLVPAEPVQRVVTLVHGTWPRGPFNLGRAVDWYRRDAAICGALYGCGQHSTVIHRFKWSGRNSATVRFKAAEELRSDLSALFERYPRRRILSSPTAMAQMSPSTRSATLPLQVGFLRWSVCQCRFCAYRCGHG